MACASACLQNSLRAAETSPNRRAIWTSRETLYVTNFFGTLNDNFLKTLASFTVIGWLPDERVKEWSKLTRLEFNRKPEEWYNYEPQTNADGPSLTLGRDREIASVSAATSAKVCG